MHSSSSDSSVSPESPTVLTPGGRLRAAREAKGLHLAMLSVTLKVPTRQLEALENDQYDAFRGPAFVRAVEQSMCRHLGIDPAPVLAGLPQTATSMALRPSAVDAPVHQTVRARRTGPGLRVSRQVMVLGGLMLLGSAALIWWPMPSTTDETQAEVVEPVQALPTEASEPVALASAPEASVDQAMPAPSPSPSPSATASVPITMVPVKPAASANLPASAPATSLSAPAHVSDLVIVASGDTWLEVRDARGQLVVNRLLKAGETQTIDFPPPLNVVVGRAHLVRVTRGGKDVDLTPYTKASTARFDIQP